MTQSLQDLQDQLPACFPLFRYVPVRQSFNWKAFNPATVRSVVDLPHYLLFGMINSASFQLLNNGWSARWQGVEKNTFVDILFSADDQQWKIVQSWCGNEVVTVFTSRMPLDEIILKVLYVPFPSSWDTYLKTRCESLFQVSSIDGESPKYGSVGIPDGVFRTIAFPVAAYNLRPLRLWLEEFCDARVPAYPVYAEVRQVFQAVSFVEGRAPAWTGSDVRLFHHSVLATGLLPVCLPEREEGQKGSSAWTLRRFLYYLFVHVPVSGITDFLERMATVDGPLRGVSDPQLEFEWQPIILPEMFEYTCESLTRWAPDQSIRLYLQFRFQGQEVPLVSEFDVAKVSKSEPDDLRRVEGVSQEIVTAIRNMS